MRSLNVLFPIFIATICLSCSFHPLNREEAIRLSKKSSRKVNQKVIIEDSNRILKVLTRDSRYRDLDVIYHFDDSGKQLKYTLIANCDSCFQIYISKIVNEKKV
jgi:hypothetical protein